MCVCLCVCVCSWASFLNVWPGFWSTQHTHTRLHTLTYINQPWSQADRQRPDKVERTAWGFFSDHGELAPKLNKKKKKKIKNWKCPTQTHHCNPGLTAQRTPARHTAYQQPNPPDSQSFHLFSCPPHFFLQANFLVPFCSSAPSILDGEKRCISSLIL